MVTKASSFCVVTMLLIGCFGWLLYSYSGVLDVCYIVARVEKYLLGCSGWLLQ